MKYWHNRYDGVVHLLDGFDLKWCDEYGDTAHDPNSDEAPTCLRCWGEWINYARQHAP